MTKRSSPVSNGLMLGNAVATSTISPLIATMANDGNPIVFGITTGPGPVAVNLSGTDGDDTLEGSDHADTISGLAGKDTLYGYGGNDALDGGDGDDIMLGGDGNDSLWGGAGDDQLNGGAGDDTLNGDAGRNTMSGGEGNDTLSASPGSSGTLDGGSGNDKLSGGAGVAYLGGAGDDLIDVDLYGKDSGPTTIDGGDGKDTIKIRGDASYGSNVSVSGGNGADVFVLDAFGIGTAISIRDFGAGAGGDVIDLLRMPGLQGGVNPLASGQLRLVASGTDTLLQRRDAVNESVYHTLFKLAGIQPGQLTGANFMGGIDPRGGTTGIILTGTTAADKLEGMLLDDTLNGEDGADILYGGGGNDLIDGGAGDDYLDDTSGSNTLRGGEGNDRLRSGSGNDRMSGGAGNDQLMLVSLGGKAHTVSMEGDEGDDLLHVSNATGSEKVLASGGSGADTFRIGAYADLTITDFSQGDRLDLRPLLVSQTTSGNPFGTLGYLKAEQAGTQVKIYVDSDGAARNGSGFKLAVTLDNTTFASLSSASFIGGFAPSGSERGLDLLGTPAADTLLGGLLDDTIEGGAGNDNLAGSKGKDRLYGGDGDDQLDGDKSDVGGIAEGDDPQVNIPGGDDFLDGGAGKDILTTSWGADTLLGGAGDDVLLLRSAPSSLPKSTYEVTLDGGDGNDFLEVSSSVQSNVTASMTGGAGSDTFALLLNPRVQGATRIITDFQAGAGGDVLDMFDFMGFTRESPFASGRFLLEQRGADTVVRYDDNGPTAPGPVFDVVVLKDLVKETLTAANIRYGYAPDGSPALMAPELRGTDGRDRLDGDARADTLYGGDGNDILAGFAGNDYLNGGNGTDTAVFLGNFADYTVRPVNPQDFTVSELRDGARDGKDRLVGIERLVFADTALAIGVGDDGGTAFQAYRIYRAAFDREPDLGGLGFWIEMLDRGVSLQTVGSGFTQGDEFTRLYGANPSNADIVTRLYRNILDREPEQAGYEFWLSVLDNKLADLGTVLAAFSESQENQDAVWELVGNAVFYQPYIG
ncbi:DUF4214 domain-containing protein [Massilia sp. BKSP1R2A-1]|uniref:DUF4214 domain-containing protein n=1 Tax=Massilia sp. BKSP1R2A-1 TaxID=3422595 RepID=UPI003D331550